MQEQKEDVRPGRGNGVCRAFASTPLTPHLVGDAEDILAVKPALLAGELKLSIAGQCLIVMQIRYRVFSTLPSHTRLLFPFSTILGS